MNKKILALLLLCFVTTKAYSDTLITVGVTLSVVSLGVATIIAPDTYSSVRNSISQLGAQNYDHAWIMRFGLFSLGSSVVLSSILQSRKPGRVLVQILPLFLYGVLLVASSFAFSSTMVARLFTEREPRRKVIHGVGIVYVIATSAMVGLVPEYSGLSQRFLWAGSFIWLTLWGTL